MDGSTIAHWVTPLVLFTFAGTFIYTNRMDPMRRSPHLLPAAYIVAGLAFVIENSLGTSHVALLALRMLGDQLYVVSCMLMAAAFYARQLWRVPWAALLFGWVLTGGANAYFWLGASDIWARTMSTASGSALMLLVALVPLMRGRRMSDRVLAVMVFTLSIAIFAAALGGSPAGAENFDDSAFASFINLTVTLGSIFIALTLLFEAFQRRSWVLQRMAQVDPLTSVLNRRGFDQLAESMVAQCLAAGRPTCLIVIDLDRFDALVELYGAPMGDRVIHRFGTVLHESLGRTELLGRMAGSQFALVIPDCEPALAEIVAQDLRERVAAMSFAPEAPMIRVTAAFGIAAITSTFADAYVTGDTRLVMAQSHGGNCIIASDRIAQSVSARA